MLPFTRHSDGSLTQRLRASSRSVPNGSSVSLTGFRRDGKGLKSADYYDLFFDLGAQVRLAARAAFKNIPPSKKPKAGKRFAKMRDGAWLDPSIDLDLPDDIRVDQLAEWCYYVETLLQ